MVSIREKMEKAKELKEFNKAEQDFEKALSIAPKDWVLRELVEYELEETRKMK